LLQLFDEIRLRARGIGLKMKERRSSGCTMDVGHVHDRAVFTFAQTLAGARSSFAVFCGRQFSVVERISMSIIQLFPPISNPQNVEQANFERETAARVGLVPT